MLVDDQVDKLHSPLLRMMFTLTEIFIFLREPWFRLLPILELIYYMTCPALEIIKMVRLLPFPSAFPGPPRQLWPVEPKMSILIAASRSHLGGSITNAIYR